MPVIDWPKELKEPSYVVDSPFAHSNIEEGYGEYETYSWKQVRDELLGLAQPCMVEEDGLRRRDQLMELRKLMGRVSVERRKLIADEINSRVDSLVDFFNEDYLDKLDGRRRSGPVRRFVVKPLMKFFAKRVLRWLIQPVLEVNVLRPGSVEGKSG